MSLFIILLVIFAVFYRAGKNKVLKFVMLNKK